MSEEELIETLKAFENNRVEQLEEPARNLFYAIMKIADERDKLNNIINELEKYLNEQVDYMTHHSIERMVAFDCCRHKLQELKGDNNVI